MKAYLQKLNFPTVFLPACLCLCGLFHEFLACFAGAALLIWLCVYTQRKKSLRLYINLTATATLVMTVGYLFTSLYATDSGSAVIGFFRILPVLLFLLVMMQYPDGAQVCLRTVPPVACIMTLVSSVLMQFARLEKWFSVSDRAAGFFQYSNTFALFLLIAFIITATKEKLGKTDYLYIPVFIFGILYSGSRTVFVLTVVALAGIILFGKNKKTKIIFGITALGMTLAAVLFAVLTDNFDSVGRFLTMSVTESTFAGRFLYFIDALPVILKHPFGMGYLGYFYEQQSFQTGVYAVKFVHNDFLQLLLDIGWIPAILFVAAVVRSFLKKGGSLQKRLLILVITAHSCFDFDLQFIAIFMLFILLLDYNDGKEKEIKIARVPTVLAATFLSAILLYTGTAQALTYFKKYELAAKIYPWDTVTQVKLLENCDSADEAEQIADRILRRNEYITAAYNKKAMSAYQKGDFTKVIEYKQKAMDTAVFSYETRIEYCYMLINGIYLYTQNKDDYSVQVCRRELLQTVQAVQQADSLLSKTGTMIDDQPRTDLPDDIREYMAGLSDDTAD